MRADMFKVIVERPRRGSRYSRDGRSARNDADAPARMGMKYGYVYTKWLNENLAPLRRFLHKQAGQPWNDVYSALCQHIDRRNTVQAHIFTHIDDFVVQHTRATANGIEALSYWPARGWMSLREIRTPLFVHPQSGLLLRNEEYLRERQRQREAKRAEQRKLAAERCRIDANTVLERIDSIWYRVTYAPLPEKIVRMTGRRQQIPHYERRWDVKKRDWVALPAHWAQCHRYGPHPVYAKAKQQLSKREIKQRGLQRSS